MEPSKCALDRPLQFVCGFRNSQLDSRCLMAYRKRLEAGKSGFEHAPFIVTPRFVAIRVTEMNFHTSNPVGKTTYSALHTGMNEAHDILSSLNVVVCVDLNLHEFSLSQRRFIQPSEPEPPG
jgi:hypothetical protein